MTGEGVRDYVREGTQEGHFEDLPEWPGPVGIGGGVWLGLRVQGVGVRVSGFGFRL